MVLLPGGRLDWTSALRLPVVCGDGLLLGRDLLGLLLSCTIKLVRDVPRPRRVDVDSGPHRGGERDLLDVPALRGRRLRAHDLVDQSGVVLDERTLVEGLLADRDVHVGAAVSAVLQLAGLRVAD